MHDDLLCLNGVCTEITQCSAFDIGIGVGWGGFIERVSFQQLLQFAEILEHILVNAVHAEVNLIAYLQVRAVIKQRN